MLTFLFWNINKKPLYDVVADLASINDVDVLVFAECKDSDALVRALAADGGKPSYHLLASQSRWITVAARFPPRYIREIEGLARPGLEPSRTAVYSLRRPLDPEPGLLLVATHLQSRKEEPSPHRRQTHHAGLSMHIAQAERIVGHRRTVLVGDLNDDPFTDSVVDRSGLHATMTRALATARAEPGKADRRPAFYSPMWAHMGELAPGPPGTYFYDRDEMHFWHVFDQVLVRPSLLGLFDDRDVRILDQRDHPQLGIGRGSAATASDHLPLLFSLSLP
ncbi:MAG: endonuclease/exonuclease/phosphatase family protein [Armatimonadetes bacterium]|nr:endonuclease/exonuclease/phosphatase family protein [Armatimonadota bacterium]